MPNYTIGDMIHETRIQRGYSQEELSFGICSPSSLSRIENNAQVPSKRMFDALMQRLGVSESIYSAYISKEEMELYRLTQKMSRKIADKEYCEVETLLNIITPLINEKDKLNLQYVYFAKAIVLKNKGKDQKIVLKTLMDAIRITMPDFQDKKTLKKKLLTFNEITILNNIALIYWDMRQEQFCLDILFWLKYYMEEHKIDEYEMADKYPMVLHNIVNRIGPAGRFEDAILLCNSGITFCIEYGKLLHLPYFIVDKACAMAELEQFEEAKKLFLQSIIILSIVGNKKAIILIKEKMRDYYSEDWINTILQDLLI